MSVATASEELLLGGFNARTPWKATCRVASSTNLTLAGEQTVDGVACEDGDRVLVTGQTAAKENGIYVVSTGAWTRAKDYRAENSAQLGTTVLVAAGTSNSGEWRMTAPTSGTVTPGVTSTTWTKIGEFASGGGGTLRDVAFDSDVTLTGSRRMVVEAADLTAEGLCIIAQAAGATHVAGAELVVVVPTGISCTGVVGPTEWGSAAWDAYDAAKPYVVTLYCATTDVVVGSGRAITVDAAVPTLTSATVDAGNPDAVVLVFSEAVYLPNLTGLTVALTLGTRTIAAIEAGNGTTTVTLTLSAAFDGSETGSFVVGASRTLHDLNGNLLGTGSTAISVTGFGGALYTIPGATHVWRGDDVTTSGSDVLTVVDQVGSLDQVAITTSPTTTTVGSLAAPAWTFVAGSKLSADPASGEVMTSGAIACVVDISTGGDLAFICGGRDGAEATFELLLFQASGATLLGFRDNGSSGNTTGAFSSTSLVDMVLTWNGSQAECYVDGALLDADLTAVVVQNIGRWTLGMSSDLSSFGATGVVMGEAQTGTTYLTAGDAADYHAHRLAVYGT